MSWKEEYERKTITPEEAAKKIKAGDHVAFAYGLEPNDLALALIAQTGKFEIGSLSNSPVKMVKCGLTKKKIPRCPQDEGVLGL